MLVLISILFCLPCLPVSLLVFSRMRGDLQYIRLQRCTYISSGPAKSPLWSSRGAIFIYKLVKLFIILPWKKTKAIFGKTSNRINDQIQKKTHGGRLLVNPKIASKIIFKAKPNKMLAPILWSKKWSYVHTCLCICCYKSFTHKTTPIPEECLFTD